MILRQRQGQFTHYSAAQEGQPPANSALPVQFRDQPEDR